MDAIYGDIDKTPNIPTIVNAACLTLKSKFENLKFNKLITVTTPTTLFSSPKTFPKLITTIVQNKRHNIDFNISAAIYLFLVSLLSAFFINGFKLAALNCIA